MASPTVSPLESLPLIVLEFICEYLDDYAEKRRSLWAFTLTSSRCCAAATVQRFCQIRLELGREPNGLEGSLRRLNDVLNPGGRHRHVRRLKVSWALGSKDEEAEEADEADEADQAGDNESITISDGLDTRQFFHMHPFCRPARPSGGHLAPRRVGIPGDRPEAWQPLGGFLSELPGLKDLVWACGHQVPRPVLSAVHAGGCRLHVHKFSLASLVQYRGSPQPIDPDEYELVTSPSLVSIVAKLSDFDDCGRVSYNVEAVARIVAGLAPNLAHVWLGPAHFGQTLDQDQAYRLGKPAWGGFFPGTAEAEKDGHELPVRRNFESLVFDSYIHLSLGINTWGRSGGLVRLRRLAMPWSLESGAAFAELAMSGGLPSVDMLKLSGIEDETDASQQALNRVLDNLKPLRQLHLDGYISSKTFDTVMRRHGGTLHSLVLHPWRDPYYQEEDTVDFSPNPEVDCCVVAQKLAEHCPHLEEASLWIRRTRGDSRETGIYRALSRLPRLRRLYLQLLFAVGEYPATYYQDAVEIPFEFLREAFSNSATDATLARSIFDMISAGGEGSLRYLQLEPRRLVGREVGWGPTFEDILRWLARPWVCKRDGQGTVTVKELDRKGTEEARESFAYLSRESETFDDGYDYGQQVFKEVYNQIWPPKTAEWWDGWMSLPLSAPLD